MGPRSDNRGYANTRVERQLTEEASMGPRSDNRGYSATRNTCPLAGVASMGPRSDNRGYDVAVGKDLFFGLLQWVHGRITVVTRHRSRTSNSNPWASMGPRSDNRGYSRGSAACSACSRLQWVHGRITVVTRVNWCARRCGACFNGSTVG